MEYRINCDVWKSVFAVPSTIVDEKIKLSGAAQLKVILWVLRHWGEAFEIEDISKALNMQAADVKDCMQYWCEMGVMQTGESEEVKPEKCEEAPKKEIVILRPEKPDAQYTAQRIMSDASIAYLMTSAENAFGRMISQSDKSTLLFINEYYGLPVEVIIMMLEYAAGIGKCSMKYIQAIAADWSEREILTLESAEERIQYLTERGNTAKRLQEILEQNSHSPTKMESKYADLWLNEWQCSEDMIRNAYEECVNNTGKLNYNYMGKIMEDWHEIGVTSAEEAKEKKNKKSRKSSDSYKATYDIAAYESKSAADSEEWN